MRSISLLVVLCATGILGCSNSEKAEVDLDEELFVSSLESREARLSYFLGYRDVANFQAEGLTIELEGFAEGARAAKAGEASLVGNEEAVELGQYFTKRITEEENKRLEEVKSRSQAFLEENASKEAVVTVGSGLQYRVIELGGGEFPTPNSTVRVHYEGRLISGEVFDSSIERGVAAEFPLTAVIAGWAEGLQLMPEGSKFEFYIPSELAYGERGSGSIGPNEALIFIVELLNADISSK